MRERTDLESRINGYQQLERDLKDNVELIELGEMEDDATVVADAEEALRGLRHEVTRQQIDSMLSGEADANDAYVEINAGAGGTESQDWAKMLLRMYTRWAERKGYKVELLEEHDGEEAGIKSATIQVKGHNAYGWLKTESGVHRLVRISPYRQPTRAGTRRFSSVWVYPVVDDRIDIDVERERRADRHLPRLRRRRPARQQDRLGRAHHPHPDRHRRRLPDRALAAQEPRHGLEDAARAPLRAGAARSARKRRWRMRRQDRHRLGPPDPLLRPAAVPDGEGPAHRVTRPATPAGCSTATSTCSWRRRWPCEPSAPSAATSRTSTDAGWIVLQMQ